MSSTSTTLTSVLSALGGSTGIDVASAVNTILYAKRAPERTWQAQQSTLTDQTTALNKISDESSAVVDALNALQSRPAHSAPQAPPARTPRCSPQTRHPAPRRAIT